MSYLQSVCFGDSVTAFLCSMIIEMAQTLQRFLWNWSSCSIPCSKIFIFFYQALLSLKVETLFMFEGDKWWVSQNVISLDVRYQTVEPVPVQISCILISNVWIMFGLLDGCVCSLLSCFNSLFVAYLLLDLWLTQTSRWRAVLASQRLFLFSVKLLYNQ